MGVSTAPGGPPAHRQHGPRPLLAPLQGYFDLHVPEGRPRGVQGPWAGREKAELGAGDQGKSAGLACVAEGMAIDPDLGSENAGAGGIGSAA